MPTAPAHVVDAVRTRLGRTGVWLAPRTLGAVSADAERGAAAGIEALGYGSLWSGEAIGGKEAFAHHGILLAATRTLVIGTGIANLWARHGATTHAGAATLAEAYPGRFVLGVGVSHPRFAELTGRHYGRPLHRMRDHVDQMDAAVDGAPRVVFPRVLAALRPKMLELARERADGVHTFLAPVEHTARARRILGPDKLLIPHQAVVLEADPSRARAIARANFAGVDPLSAYAENLRSLGYGDEDLDGGFRDRLLDAVIAWGDERAIAERVQEHLDAGADHVLIQPVTREGMLMRPGPEDTADALAVLERLASAPPRRTGG